MAWRGPDCAVFPRLGERLAAVAMRMKVTGSPLYAGLWREERWCRAVLAETNNSMKKKEEVCSAVNACL